MVRRRYIVAAVGAIAVFGSVAASAATLGGVTAASLGADVTTVAACDTDGVTLAYTTSFASGGYQVTAVTVSGINAACTGQNLRLALTDTAGATGTTLFSSASQAVAGTTATVTVTPTVVTAAAVKGAAVIIGS